MRDSEATAARLIARGHAAFIAPVMRIVATKAAPPTENFDALIATSAPALELLAQAAVDSLRDLPMHVVGARAAAAARARGFRKVSDPLPDVAALTAALLANAPCRGRFLYLAGRDRKPLLEAALREANHRVEAVIMYEARAETALAGEAVALLNGGKIDAVLHFSRRSAQLFLDLARAAGAGGALRKLTHVCISQDAAAPLRDAGLVVRAAPAPDTESLIAALERDENA